MSHTTALRGIKGKSVCTAIQRKVVQLLLYTSLAFSTKFCLELPYHKYILLNFRSLVLFKLLLLERKVLLFQSPVVDLTSFLLTLLSLHPGMLEGGLDESACVVPLDTPPLSLSPDCDITVETSLDKDIDTVSIKYLAHFARSAAS